MGLFTLEHSRAVYRADLWLYGLACAALAGWLLLQADRNLALAAWVLGGLAGWTLVEYGLHRFVLHGLKPFSTLHGEHHRRPMALICTPTVFSASLVFGLVWLPAWWALDTRPAGALTLGVLLGYLAYSVTHHATHHWSGGAGWLSRRKRWHALHHGAYRLPLLAQARPGCFGVTTRFWDHVFGTLPAPRPQMGRL